MIGLELPFHTSLLQICNFKSHNYKRINIPENQKLSAILHLFEVGKVNIIVFYLNKTNDPNIEL